MAAPIMNGRVVPTTLTVTIAVSIWVLVSAMAPIPMVHGRTILPLSTGDYIPALIAVRAVTSMVPTVPPIDMPTTVIPSIV